MADHAAPPPAGSRRSGWPFLALPPPAAPPRSAGFRSAAPATGSRSATAPPGGSGPWNPPPAGPPPVRSRPAGSPPAGGSPSGPPPSDPSRGSPPRRDRGRSPWSKPLAVMLVLVGVFAVGAGLGRTAGPFDWAEASAGSSAAAPAPATTPARKPVGRPVRLSVPAIKVDAPVTPVGQARDGSVDVPPLTETEQTGWYNRGAVPGEPGRAIIVGHVDSKSGPAVFYRLRELKPGALIRVTRTDRSVVSFTVDSVEYFDKAKLPAARVYGDSGPAELRLITCGGTWLGGRTGYEDNVIVFATRTA